MAVTGEFAFPILGALQAQGTPVDGYWADDACIDERRADDDQIDAKRIDLVRQKVAGKVYTLGALHLKNKEVNPNIMLKVAV